MEQKCPVEDVASPATFPSNQPRGNLGFNDYEELSALLNLPVMADVDQQMLKLYKAMLKTFGSSFEPPSGELGIERTRRIVSQWGPQMYDSTVDPTKFGLDLAKSKFFSRYLSAAEYQFESKKLEVRANIDNLKIMLEGHGHNARIKDDEALKPLLNSMRHIVHMALGEFDLLTIYKNIKHGPNSTSTIEKSMSYMDVKDFDLTGTPESLQQYWHYLRWNNILSEYLVDNSQAHRSFLRSMDFSVCNVVDFTPTLQVPKKFDTLRTIRQEPTVPAQFAQGMASVLTEALFKVGIDLSSQQEVHRNLARIGSLYPETNIATIDWKEASERIWLSIADEVLPEDHNRFIKACCRTPSTLFKFKFDLSSKEDRHSYKEVLGYLNSDVIKDITIEKDKKGRFINMQFKVLTPMVATMGNPITFPLQTLIFYAFLAACSDLAALRLAKDPSAEGLDDMFISCFGDDGICSTRAIPEIQFWAKSLGWVFNDNKSFYQGRFRESCGGDFYCGKMVRPIQLERPPKTQGRQYGLLGEKRILQAWSYVAANAACDLVQRYKFEPRLIYDWLISFHDRYQLGKVCLIPPNYPEGSGLRVTLIQDVSYTCEGVGRFCDRYDPAAMVPLLPHDVLDECHKVSWDPKLQEFRFRELYNEPRKVTPFGVGEISYYAYAARRFTKPLFEGKSLGFNHRTFQEEYKVYRRTGAYQAPIVTQAVRFKNSFFDITGLNPSSLDSCGNIPLKEIRLKKRASSTPQWGYWLPVIHLV